MLYFYFPRVGTFKHFPTNLSVNGEVVARAPSTTLSVKKRQVKIDEADIDDVLATGSIPKVLEFMRTKNILGGLNSVRFKINDVYWMCKDINFYREGKKILHKRGIFDYNFLSFSILHNDLEGMKEFFSSDQMDLKRRVGPQFKSTLLTVNNSEESQDIFNFRDFYPIVNARAHRVSGTDEASS